MALRFDLPHRSSEPLARAEVPETEAVDEDDAHCDDGVVQRLGVDRLGKESAFVLMPIRSMKRRTVTCGRMKAMEMKMIQSTVSVPMRYENFPRWKGPRTKALWLYILNATGMPSYVQCLLLECEKGHTI